jgi:hypothetical protein
MVSPEQMRKKTSRILIPKTFTGLDRISNNMALLTEVFQSKSSEYPLMTRFSSDHGLKRGHRGAGAYK